MIVKVHPAISIKKEEICTGILPDDNSATDDQVSQPRIDFP